MHENWTDENVADKLVGRLTDVNPVAGFGCWIDCDVCNFVGLFSEFLSLLFVSCGDGATVDCFEFVSFSNCS